MAYNPYQVAQSQTGLMEALLGAEQKKKTMQTATSGQMAKMEKDFDAQLRAAQKRAEEALRQKKPKKGAWLANITDMVSGVLLKSPYSALISGLTSICLLYTSDAADE